MTYEMSVMPRHIRNSTRIHPKPFLVNGLRAEKSDRFSSHQNSELTRPERGSISETSEASAFDSELVDGRFLQDGKRLGQPNGVDSSEQLSDAASFRNHFRSKLQRFVRANFFHG